MTSSLRWNLIDCDTHHGAPEAFPESIAAANGHFRLHWEKLSGGLRDGVHVLTVDTGAVRVAILPERGMGIWKCWRNDTEFGWQSPVRGPVHPHFVPIQDASGIGWLEGFDELVVRCGLESNGAPEFDDRGNVRYPLHGRIANRPAYRLTVEVDPMAGVLDVRGWVEETRFLIRSTSLLTHYQFRVNQPGLPLRIPSRIFLRMQPPFSCCITSTWVNRYWKRDPSSLQPRKKFHLAIPMQRKTLLPGRPTSHRPQVMSSKYISLSPTQIRSIGRQRC